MVTLVLATTAIGVYASRLDTTQDDRQRQYSSNTKPTFVPPRGQGISLTSLAASSGELQNMDIIDTSFHSDPGRASADISLASRYSDLYALLRADNGSEPRAFAIITVIGDSRILDTYSIDHQRPLESVAVSLRGVHHIELVIEADLGLTIENPTLEPSVEPRPDPRSIWDRASRNRELGLQGADQEQRSNQIRPCTGVQEIRVGLTACTTFVIFRGMTWMIERYRLRPFVTKRGMGVPTAQDQGET
jgi:hypothetical protein